MCCIYVDGLATGDFSDVVLRDRTHLSNDGIVIAVVAIRAAALPRPSGVLVAALAATLGYAALSRGARLLPTTYAAIMAGIGVALVAGRFRGSP